MTSRRLMYVALVAACAAAIAVPVALSQTGDDDAGDDSPPSTEWPVQASYQADLDGDGSQDAVRLRRDGEAPDPGPIRVEAELTSGATPFLLLSDDTVDLAMAEVTDFDLDEREELLFVQELVEPADTSEVLLVALDRGELVVVPKTRQAPIASGFDEQGRLQSWWIDKYGILLSSRSVDAFPSGTLPDRYEVDVWTWSHQDEGLKPLHQPRSYCTSPGAARAEPCDLPPAVMREVSRTIGVGETASLADPIPTLSLRREGDRVVLHYSFSGNRSSVTLPDRPGEVQAWVGMVHLGDTYGFLVGWGHDPTEMRVYAAVERGLLELPFVADAPRLETSESYYTFVAKDGTLYTRETVNPGTNEYRLWSWSMTNEGEVALAPTEDGIWCLDYVEMTGSRC